MTSLAPLTNGEQGLPGTVTTMGWSGVMTCPLERMMCFGQTRKTTALAFIVAKICLVEADGVDAKRGNVRRARIAKSIVFMSER